MKSSRIISLLIILYTAFSCDRKQDDSVVYSSNIMPGLFFYLHQDNFRFIYQQNNTIDSTFGTVKKLNDTLFLTVTRNENEVRSEGNGTIGGFVSIGELFSNKRNLMRPRKLLIQGDQLIYLDPVTNQPLTFQNSDNIIQVFLKRLK
jgi:hypothetical protein